MHGLCARLFWGRLLPLWALCWAQRLHLAQRCGLHQTQTCILRAQTKLLLWQLAAAWLTPPAH